MFGAVESFGGPSIGTQNLLNTSGAKVAVLGAPFSEAWNTDVQTKLVATGLFSQVDVINIRFSTPSLAQLQEYAAVIVYSDENILDRVTLGNNLADYADGGGGVVIAAFAFANPANSYGIGGRISTGGYLPFSQASYSFGNPLTMVVDDPSHPILDGVNSFSGGTNSWHNNSISLVPGATLVAHWSNNQPLVGVKETNGRRVVGLNMFPPSSDGRSDFWASSSDGAKLMGNALTYSANVACSNPDVLIIYDVNSAGTQALKTALENAGMNVTLSSTPETGYDGTNPSPAGFDAIIHMNGTTYGVDMPIGGQQALVNFVQSGGAYIHSEWDAFDYGIGYMQSMRDLILYDRDQTAVGNQGTAVLTEVVAESSHPVLANVPASFSFTGSWNPGNVHNFASEPATVLMKDHQGNDAVAVRQFGSGRIIGFHHSGNYNGDGILSNANIQQLYIDGIKWAAKCGYTQNQPPAGLADSYSTVEDSPLTKSAAEGVLANDTDADNDALMAVLVSGPEHADTFTLNADGSFDYTPAANYNGPDSFKYKANDGTADSDEITVSIDVVAANDAPVLSNVPVSATIDEMATYGFTATATDVENNGLTFSLVGAPAGASIDPATGVFSWTPTEAQGPGSYTFAVRVTDDDATSPLYDEESITITVNEVNLAPELGNIANLNGYWGAPFAFTATATDADLPANTLTYSLVGAPAGASINPTSGAFTWTPLPAQIGQHTFTVRVTDNGSPAMSDEQSVTITVGKRPTALVYTGDGSEQYSDQQALSATLTDVGLGATYNQPLSGKTVLFVIGNQSVSDETDGSGVAAIDLILTQNPALTYTVNSSFAGDSLYLSSSDSDAFDITQEDARVYYTGSYSFNTQCGTCSNAVITLAATVRDITAESGEPETDSFAGDIRNAKVTFINMDNGQEIATVSVGLADPSDPKTGTAVYNWNFNLGSENSAAPEIGIKVGGYYTRYTGDDNVILSVVKPTGTNFITGGGYLVISNSIGTHAAAFGSKSNFGFNVKYNKSGKNLQGNLNLIVRSNDDRVYQVKGNVLRTLTVNTITSKPLVMGALFTGKANLTDITDPLNPIALGGNMTLQMELTDKGEPGKSDLMGITVWNDAGGLVFSSNWSGVKTLQQVLGGGNVVVR